MIVPVYPQSGKAEVFTWQLRALVAEALAKCRRARASPIRSTSRSSIAHDLVDRGVALRAIHRPESMAELRAAREPADLRRVPAHAGRARRRASARSRPRSRGSATTSTARSSTRSSSSCRSRSPATSSARSTRSRTTSPAPAPMHRLLQGDVGSGKTVVALAALLVAVQGGYQGAFMAPTEVLAEQHYLGSLRLLEGLDGPRPRARCSRDRPVARRAADQPHDRGRAPPHRRRARTRARSTSSSARTRCSTATREFTNLGVAVIDEQHRFGVEQRALLAGQGRSSPTCS